MLTPEQLQHQINEISDDYYELAQQMASIQERKGTSWLELRQTCKTNGETDHKWAATADGKREAYLKWMLKGMEKKRGAMVLEWKANSGIL